MSIVSLFPSLSSFILFSDNLRLHLSAVPVVPLKAKESAYQAIFYLRVFSQKKVSGTQARFA